MFFLLGLTLGAAVFLAVLSQVFKIDLKGLVIGAFLGVGATLGAFSYFGVLDDLREWEEFKRSNVTNAAAETAIAAVETAAPETSASESAASETGAIDVEIVGPSTPAQNNLDNNCPAYVKNWVATEMDGTAIDDNVATEFCGCIKAAARGDVQIAAEISNAGDRLPAKEGGSAEMREAIGLCIQHAGGG